MSKIKWKGGTMMSPVPAVLVSCSDGEKDNIFTVAWTGIVCSNPPRTYVSVRPERFSYDLIKKSGEFCINLPSSYLVRAVDFCGVRSGKDMDKFEMCRLTREQSQTVACPSVAECPITLECKVFEEKELGSHTMFLADITAVTVDERIVGEDGKMRIEKANLMAYGHGTYFTLGKRIGTFGYAVKKRK
ncbi:MAG: flavin reductase family protein [Clostridia bacterium]|nr:flavin reductase family protein [Clostridia bacterium]